MAQNTTRGLRDPVLSLSIAQNNLDDILSSNSVPGHVPVQLPFQHKHGHVQSGFH